MSLESLAIPMPGGGGGLLPGTLLGRRYRLHETLGHGGMGIVYRATDRLTGAQVALKRVTTTPGTGVLFSAGEDSAFLRLALAHEFQLLASLRHPHIISVLDYGFDDERAPYFTMELLEGARTILQAGRNQDRKHQVALLVQTLEALAYLHRHGILHRDLKPSNVLVVDGQVKLLDFGLASVRDGAHGKVGTPAYMAPEVLLDKPLGPASDLYALGVIAYQLFTGRHPYDMSSLKRLLADIVSSNPDLAHLDAVLAGTILPEPEAIHSTDVETAAATLQAAGLARTAVPHDELTRLEIAMEGGETEPLPLLSETPALSPLAAIVGRLMSRRSRKRPHHDAVEVIRELCQAASAPVPPESFAIRESFLRAARFVGREREITHLSEALAEAFAGRGGAWLIGGESGIGKSRLLTELATMARVQGALLLQGQAVSEAESPFHVWRGPIERLALAAHPDDSQAAILKAVAPTLDAVLGCTIPDAPSLLPEALREALIEATVGLFGSTTEPVVLLLEDLQWAGDESLAVLQRLSRLCTERPLLIVASYRDEDRPGLPVMLGDMHTLKLGRLDEKSVLELGVSMLGSAALRVADLLQQESEGNVFFLVEAVRALAEDTQRLDEVGLKPLPVRIAPAEVRRVVERRLERVGSEARPLLEAAAVLGRQLDLGVLAALAPDTDISAWLTRCESAAVLDVAEGHWRFAHDRLREGVLAGLDEDQRRLWHRRLADVLHASAAPVTSLAHHLLQGEAWDEAAGACMRAAEEAAQLYLHAKAGAHCLEALAALCHLEPSVENRRRRVDTTVRLAIVSAFADSPERNLALLAEAETIVRALPGDDGVPGSDALRIARVHHVLGRCHYVRNEIPKAIACWTRGLAAAQQVGDEELLALPSSVIGRAHAAQGRYGEAAPLLERASAPLERAANWPEWIAATACLAAALAARGDYAAGLAEGERALAKARETSNLTAMAVCHILRCTVRLHGNDTPGMLQEAQAAVAAAERSGDLVYSFLGNGMLAWAEGRAGRIDDAARSMSRAKDVGRDLGGRVFVSELFAAVEAELALRAGDAAEAVRLAEVAVTQARALGGVFAEGQAERSWGLALAALPAPGTHEAESHLERSILRLEAGAAFLEAARTRLAWAKIQDDRGDTAGAQSLRTAGRAVLHSAGLPH